MRIDEFTCILKDLSLKLLQNDQQIINLGKFLSRNSNKNFINK